MDWYSIVIWTETGLEVRQFRSNEELQEWAIEKGLYDSEGLNESGDKWIVFRGQMQDSSERI